VEDPIEYLHRHQSCLVNQREVGSDTKSFAIALKYALRQDPDVVLVGEMRDLETISEALNISETGHLTFATLHTNSCAETINRIVDVFPTNQQEQIRVTVSFVLQGVVSQQLVPRIGGGRVLATEVMMCMIQAGQKFGMRTMNMSLAELHLSRKITIGEAMARSSNVQELNEMLSRVQTATEARY
jgi:twitching motility protein PilT